VTGVTLSRFSTDRGNPQFRDSGILSLVLILSVTKLFKNEVIKRKEYVLNSTRYNAWICTYS